VVRAADCTRVGSAGHRAVAGSRSAGTGLAAASRSGSSVPKVGGRTASPTAGRGVTTSTRAGPRTPSSGLRTHHERFVRDLHHPSERVASDRGRSRNGSAVIAQRAQTRLRRLPWHRSRRRGRVRRSAGLRPDGRQRPQCSLLVSRRQEARVLQHTGRAGRLRGRGLDDECRRLGPAASLPLRLLHRRMGRADLVARRPTEAAASDSARARPTTALPLCPGSRRWASIPSGST
jgi:hypothetical protein